MLDVFNRLAHGFVAVPVIIACRERGLFEVLQQGGEMTLPELVMKLQANSGHLEVALRMMRSLNWISRDGSLHYSLRPEAEKHRHIPKDVVELLHLPMEACLREPSGGSLKPWVERARLRWNLSDPWLADLLDGVLLVPLLGTLRNPGFGSASISTTDCFQEADPMLRAELCLLFISKGWGASHEGRFFLTDAGRFVMERTLVLGTTASYRPMLQRMPDLLFGKARDVFHRDDLGYEGHVDRTLNVIASGFQHKKYFADLEANVLSLFDRQPFEAQPRYVADMGCGDGTLLKRIYEIVRERSARGKVLDQYPLRLIGVDYNQKALRETEKTLAGIPHLVLQGDIGDPERLIADLRRMGVHDTEQILHVRSFLDHDRPFIAPSDPARAAARSLFSTDGVNVDREGNLIPAPMMLQSLVEHLGRWSLVVNAHGLLLLEVHSLPAEAVFGHLDLTESLHFDAYHAFSNQYLVEAELFLRAAAENGLFPKSKFSKRYPKTLPVTRITLNWFEKRPYTVREARVEDLPALLNLEAQCWLEPLRAPIGELAQRLNNYPEGNWVLRVSDRIVGAIYSQRIAQEDRLKNVSYEEVLSLHDPAGKIIQLLGMNVLPEMQQQGLGDQFLEFVLHDLSVRNDVGRVVGITRCKQYPRSGAIPFEEYVKLRNATGQLVDPVLHFHEHHGAIIKAPVFNYRPADLDNLGWGVLIEYNLHSLGEDSDDRPNPSEPLSNGSVPISSISEIVRESVCLVLGPKRRATYSPHAALMDMGLDSLELLELRSLLSTRLREPLVSTFFFEYGSPEAIVEFFQNRRIPRLEPVGSPAVSGNPLLAIPESESKGHGGLTEMTVLASGGTSQSEKDGKSIAIIGIGCRFPGARHPEEFWKLLREGKHSIAEVPDSRWRNDRYFNPDRNQPGRISTRYGGFLDGVDQFDAAFFRISPREAALLDPQQRLLLEVNWEALEQAGINPRSLAQTRTGVFVGIFSHDYETLQLRENVREDFDAYFSTGNSASVAAGRLSYFFGFHGPALAVNTACSSSLVAVHLACQSLRNGECELALASGVNLILAPELSIAFSRAGMLAGDGFCKTFDAAADGYVRSEGCGAVVLKRLQRAISDQDTVLAVIRGSALNQDGASNGLTAPNGLSQEAVLRQALTTAKVSPLEISYIEAHGTGTALGDPVEVKALESVYGVGRMADDPLIIGSVKTNIGHTEAAAGIAGLIKVVLSMQNKCIPPHLHFRKWNPHIQTERNSFLIPRQAMAWQPKSGKRLAGISSFGFSGTNAHLILEEPPVLQPVRTAEPSSPELWTLSAQSDQALEELAGNHAAYLGRTPGLALSDTCFTANLGRAHFEHRLALVVESREEAGAALAAFASRQAVSGLRHSGPLGRISPVAFLFTGQGAQYAGMGRELYECQPVFRQTLNRCDALLRAHFKKPLLEILYPKEGHNSLLNETAYTQPALFAFEFALAELWKSWGIEPDYVLGHSLGEYVAACVAGLFSLEDGLMLVAERAQLMQALPSGGEMAAILAGPNQIEMACDSLLGEVSIASLNGPNNTVISGTAAAVRKVIAQLEAEGFRTVRLTVSHAFHSALMEPMLAAFEGKIRQVRFHPLRIPLVSNLTGQFASDEMATPEYWCRHIREPVQFSAGLETLRHQGVDVYVEIGPKPVLLGMAQQCWPAQTGTWLPSLRPGVPDLRQILGSLADLYVRGHSIHWPGFYQDLPRRRVGLPTYPFQRQRYWIETKHGASVRSHPPQKSHPLLGRRISSPLKEIQFASMLDARCPEFLADHRVFGVVLLPAAACVEMALAAGAAVLRKEPLMLEEVAFQKAVLLTETEGSNVQMVLTPEPTGEFSFRLYTLRASPESDEPKAMLHASGKLASLSLNSARVDWTQLRNQCGDRLVIESFYDQCQKRGLEYGSSFRILEELSRGEGQALGKVRLPEHLTADAGRFKLHPVLLDAGLQVALAALPESSGDHRFLPIGLERLRFYRRAAVSFWSHARLRPASQSHPEVFTFDLQLLEETGSVFAEIFGLSLKRVDRSLFLGKVKPGREFLYQTVWQPQALFGMRPGYLPFPAAIQAKLVSEKAAPVRTETNARQLEELSFDYVLEAFNELGWAFRPGSCFTATALARELKVVPQHQRMFGRLLEMLQEDGILRKTEQQFEVVRMPEKPSFRDRCRALSNQGPGARAELTLLGRCGEKLTAVLQGKCDPLDLLFPNGDFSSVTDLYRNSPAFAAMNNLVQKTVLEALRALPCGRGVRVLEIGAGTGATTASILPTLPRDRTEYCFTDVSAAFFPKAQEAFSDYPFIQYQRLDIEHEPATQGFESQQYDLVIAANVLHATRDLRQTLRHVQQLLLPGGLLVLLEGTAPRRWIDLIFGLMEGWWRFADRDLRPRHPLLTVESWSEILREVGFERTSAISPEGPEKEFIFPQAVVISRAVVPPEKAAAPNLRAPVSSIHLRERDGERRSNSEISGMRHWLLLVDSGSVGKQLATLLQGRGDRCTLVYPGGHYETLGDDEFQIAPSSRADFQRLLECVNRRQTLAGVVHLWGLDAVSKSRLALADLEAATQIGCISALHLVQALTESRSVDRTRLWLVTRGAVGVDDLDPVSGLAQAPLWGMGKVIALEHPDLNCIRIDLDQEATAEDGSVLLGEMASSPQRPEEDQIAYRNQIRHIARLVRAADTTADSQEMQAPDHQPFQLTLSPQGILEGMTLCPKPRREPGRGEVEIRIQAAGLNFLDVMDALGVLPFERSEGPGSECAGEVVGVGDGVERLTLGDLVVGMVPGSFSQFATVNADLIGLKPRRLNCVEAATIPVNFMTAFHALHQVAGMKSGERVLIHAAAGGTGLAAVQLALKAGLEVFATASPDKWEFLRSIGVKHLMNSRTLDFANEIMYRTGGEGVDIVLNSLTGAFIARSLSVLRAGGRFLEIGKAEIWATDQVSKVNSHAAYYPIDLRRLSQEQPAAIQSMLQFVLEEFEQGRFDLGPFREYPMGAAVSAFRIMQQARHIGKIVLTMPGEAEALETEIKFRKDGSYLIVGGLGGLGWTVARWMAEKGAQHLILAGRSGASAELREQIVALEQTGVQVRVEPVDISQREQVASLLSMIATELPPLRGVIHSAGVLDDSTLLQQTPEKFARVMAPKVAGAWNLHMLTRNTPLDFFVLFSSVASLLGLPGQANHAAANAFLDALARARRAEGLPGLSINWGAWSETGAATVGTIREQMAQKGIGSITPHTGLQLLEQMILKSPAQAGAMAMNWPRFIEMRAPVPFFENFKPSCDAPQESGSEFLEQLKNSSPHERYSLVVAQVRAQVGKVLGLNASSPVDFRKGFFEIGMDSLTSVELRNRLQASTRRSLPSTLIFDHPNVTALADFLAGELGLALEMAAVPTAEASADAAERSRRSADLEGLSQRELADLLTKQLASMN
jgi:acyl transferase domain-containing protein